MAVLTLLLPPRARLAAEAALAQGPLASWWHRGDRAADAEPGREAALRGQFQFTGKTLPVAALTRQLDAADAAGAVWLRADPAYARADMTTARLLACGELGLRAAEAQALIQPLRPLFGDAGFPIDAPVPQRWYLRCPPGAQLPAFSAPADVLGDDLGRHLDEPCPPGAGATRAERIPQPAAVEELTALRFIQGVLRLRRRQPQVLPRGSGWRDRLP